LAAELVDVYWLNVHGNEKRARFNTARSELFAQNMAGTSEWWGDTNPVHPEDRLHTRGLVRQAQPGTSTKSIVVPASQTLTSRDYFPNALCLR
jgi:hypothetical protein